MNIETGQPDFVIPDKNLMLSDSPLREMIQEIDMCTPLLSEHNFFFGQIWKYRNLIFYIWHYLLIQPELQKFQMFHV